MGGATAVVAGAAVAGSVYSARKQGKAAEKAGEAQAAASEAGIEEQRRQFDKAVEILSPFVTAGRQSLGIQGAFLGLGGPVAQQQALAEFEQSPMFQSIARQGENAILQNASATGGLRGGNVQAALAQFRPQLLNQQIQQRLQNLSGLTQLGQASAAGTASAGLQTGQGISNLLGQQGAAQAGGILGKAGAQQQGISDLIGLGGTLIGAGAF